VAGQKTRTRRDRRTLATKRKLLDAARAVFAEKGLDLARIDDITERADVGKGTFYSYFRSREELVNELIRNLFVDLMDVMKEDCRGMSDLTGLLDAMIGAHIRFFSTRWEDFVLYFQGINDLKLQQGYKGIETPFLDYLGHIEELLDGVMHRELSQAFLRRIACAVAGFVSG
jgi:AcrR family transcriptional regulator